MTFDPNAYLAKKGIVKTSGGFDPQAYLANKLNGNIDQPTTLNTVQEQADYISPWQRFIAKNFANSPDSQIAYLKKQNPDKDFAMLADQVVTKSKGDQNWKVLDPADLDLQDITDMAYDIPAGIAQGAATTAGFIAGAPTGIGAMPAAMLASGGSGSALEAARQGIGKLAGIPQDISGGDVAFSGALGAAAPLAFGVDKVKGPLQGEARGLIKHGIDYLGPSVTEFFTGIDKPTQQYFRNNKEAIADLAAKGGDRQLVQSGGQKLFDYIEGTKKNLLEDAGNIQRQTPEVNIGNVKKIFTDEIDAITNKPNLTNIQARRAETLKQIYNDNFGLKYPVKPELVSLPEAKTIFSEIDNIMAQKTGAKPSIESAADFSFVDKNLPAKQDVYKYLDPGQEGFLQDVNKFARGTVDQDKSLLTNEANDLAQSLASKNASERDAALKQKLAELGQLETKYTKTELPDVVSGKDLFDLKQQLKAYSPSLTATNADATTSAVNRAVEGTINKAYNEGINQSFDQATNGASTLANKAATDFLAPLGPYDVIKKGIETKGVLDPQKTYQTMVRLGSPSKYNILGEIEKLQGKGLIDLQEPNQLRALNAFYGPSEDSFLIGAGDKAPKGSAIKTALGTIGSLAGYKLGGGYSGAAIGGGAGVAAGGGLSSKAAARGYINIGNMLDKVASKNYYLNPAFYQGSNPWEDRKP